MFVCKQAAQAGAEGGTAAAAGKTKDVLMLTKESR